MSVSLEDAEGRKALPTEQDDGPIPSIDASLLDVRSEDIDDAKEVLWKFVAAPTPEFRISHCLRPAVNAPLIRDHHDRNPRLIASDIRIVPMKAWQGPTGLNIAFETYSDLNRNGCIVEVVCSEEKNFKVSWQRFQQHYFSTFAQFHRRRQSTARASI